MLQIQNMFTYDDSKSCLLDPDRLNTVQVLEQILRRKLCSRAKNRSRTSTQPEPDVPPTEKKNKKDLQIAAAAKETFLHKNFKKQIDNMHLWKFTSTNT